MTTKRKHILRIDGVDIGNLKVSGAIMQSELELLKARIVALEKPPAVDQDATNDYDEEFLIGLWLADQREAGAKTVDLEKVETIREGMRYALELRSPS